MYGKGVTKEGKRVTLFDTLSIEIPYGSVYSKTENDGYRIQMLTSIPSNYCNGSFSIPDSTPFDWSVSFEREPIVYDYTNIPPAKGIEMFQEEVKQVAETISGNDLSCEELSYSRTIRRPEKPSYKHTIHFSIEKGSICEVLIENHLVIYRAVMKIQIGMENILYHWAVVGILDYPNASIYKVELKTGDGMDEIFRKEIVPVLKTLKNTDLPAKRQEGERGGKGEAEQRVIHTIPEWKRKEGNNSKSYLENRMEKNEITGINRGISPFCAEKEAMETILNSSTSCYNQKSVRGATEEVKAKTKSILSVLTQEPKTVDEINRELGTEYTALQVANVIKLIEHSYSKKVIREKTNRKGQKQKKEYTAYFIMNYSNSGDTDR